MELDNTTSNSTSLLNPTQAAYFKLVKKRLNQKIKPKPSLLAAVTCKTTRHAPVSGTVAKSKSKGRHESPNRFAHLTDELLTSMTLDDQNFRVTNSSNIKIVTPPPPVHRIPNPPFPSDSELDLKC